MVDFIWHLHMLHPSHYHDMTMREFGCVLNHDDVIGYHQSEKYRGATEMAWKDIPLSLFNHGIINNMEKTFQSRTRVYEGLQEKLIKQTHHRMMRLKNMFHIKER
ncbi:hypothetical protein BJV82DRAFT_594267 [Fennellomyces sp. T-0311]|nr:hypothetical protein BJV82DRAFT_594267 [Fennellomyces sp. T-0311]